MDYLGDDGVSVSLDGLLPPGRKGNTVQLTGNPIISATNRGLSWKLLPARAKKSGRLPCHGFFPFLLKFSKVGAPFQSLAVGVGSSPWKSRKSVRPLGFFSPSSVSCIDKCP
mgnify:FL=1